jgi:hypothetical protein
VLYGTVEVVVVVAGLVVVVVVVVKEDRIILGLLVVVVVDDVKVEVEVELLGKQYLKEPLISWGFPMIATF